MKSGDIDVYQIVNGDGAIYPYGLITNEALKQLKEFTNDKDKPFFLLIRLS